MDIFKILLTTSTVMNVVMAWSWSWFQERFLLWSSKITCFNLYNTTHCINQPPRDLREPLVLLMTCLRPRERNCTESAGVVPLRQKAQISKAIRVSASGRCLDFKKEESQFRESRAPTPSECRAGCEKFSHRNV